MILAPYAVVWAFVFVTITLINLGLVWLFFHEQIAGLFRHLWLSDGVAAWLAFTAAYHSLFYLQPPRSRFLDNPTAIWVLWGALAAYLLLRLLPAPRRVDPGHRAILALALMVGLWGWSIGAGYRFIDGMEADARALKEDPGRALSLAPEDHAPLLRARYFRRVGERERELLERVLAELARGHPLEPGMRSLARLELVPQLIAAYDLEIGLLESYQIFQMLLLAGVLAAWGFGEFPGRRE